MTADEVGLLSFLVSAVFLCVFKIIKLEGKVKLLKLQLEETEKDLRMLIDDIGEKVFEE